MTQKSPTATYCVLPVVSKSARGCLHVIKDGVRMFRVEHEDPFASRAPPARIRKHRIDKGRCKGHPTHHQSRVDKVYYQVGRCQ